MFSVLQKKTVSILVVLWWPCSLSENQRRVSEPVGKAETCPPQGGQRKKNIQFLLQVQLSCYSVLTDQRWIHVCVLVSQQAEEADSLYSVKARSVSRRGEAEEAPEI